MNVSQQINDVTDGSQSGLLGHSEILVCLAATFAQCRTLLLKFKDDSLIGFCASSTSDYHASVHR